MKAVHMIGYGPARDSLRIVTHAIPEPQGAEVLVKIKAASINPLDVWMRQGYGKNLFETQRKPPFILGRDFSGIVVDVGPRVWNFKPGDQVYGGIWPLHQGSFAQYLSINENSISLKPSNLSFEETASIGYAGTNIFNDLIKQQGLTAWRALIEIAQVKQGQRILINGISGAIGTFSTQLLKHMGCSVSGTCSSKHNTRMYSLGVDKLFDYKTNELEESSEKYDIVMDCVSGVNHTPQFVAKVKEGGHLLTLLGNFVKLTDNRGVIGGSLSAFVELASEKIVQRNGFNIKYDWVLFRPSGKNLEKIADLIESKAISPYLDKNYFKLDQCVEAFQYFESQSSNGKVVFNID